MFCYEKRFTNDFKLNIFKINKMKQYIFSILGVCLAFSMQAQIELGTHFMSNVAQNNLLNPAAFTDNGYKVNVSLLPSIYAGFNNSAIAPDDVLEKRGTSLYLDVEGLIEKMGANGMNIQTNLNVETFTFSFKAKKWQLSLNHGLRISSFHSIPKTMIQFAWGGNAQFVDETINIAPTQNLLAYQEFGVGFGYKISDNLTLGTRLKYLVGIGTYQTATSKANIYTDPEYYQLTADTDYLINTGGLPESDIDNGEFLNLDDFEPSLFGKNRGFAFDFGASFDINDKLNIQTSVLNIGKIKWEEDVNNYWSNGTSTFAGLDFQPLFEEGEYDPEEILDTIANTFEFTSSQNGFNTVLPSSFYLSSTYEVMPKLTVGALLFAQGFQSDLTTAFALNVKKDFGKFFSLGGQYAFIEGGASNIGLSTSLRLGPVQIYATSDNIIPLMNPMKGQNVNMRFGMNLLFGKIKNQKEELPIPTETLGMLKR
jgi:hypothetical protein